MAKRISSRNNSRKLQMALKTSRRKNFIVTLTIVLLLASIFGYNFNTRSEEIETKAITIKEFAMDKNLKDDVISKLEVKQDTDGRYYVVLPEQVDGFYVANYFVKKVDIINPEIKDNDEIEENEENKDTINEVEEVDVQDVTDEIETNEIITNSIDEENVVTTSFVRGEKRLYLSNIEIPNEDDTENIVEDNAENNTTDLTTPVNEIDETTNEIENTNVIANENVNNIVNDNATNTTITNEVVTPTETEDNSKDNNENDDNSTIEIINQDEEEDTVLEELEKLNSFNMEEYEKYSVGDKLYLTSNNSKSYKSEDFEVYAFYKTVNSNFDGTKLYERDLVNDSNQNIRVTLTGTFPVDATLNIELGQDLVETAANRIMNEYYDFSVLSAVKISIISGEQEFLIENHGITPKLKMELNDSKHKLNANEIEVFQFSTTDAENVDKDTYGIVANKAPIKYASLKKVADFADVELDGAISDDSNNQVELNERYEDVTQTDNSVEIVVDNLRGEFAVIFLSRVQMNTLEIDDQLDDYNYYIGRNYVESIDGVNSGKYTDSNLKAVTINYNGTPSTDLETILADQTEYFYNVLDRVPNTDGPKESQTNSNFTQGPTHYRLAYTNGLMDVTSQLTYTKDDFVGIDRDSPWKIELLYVYANVSEHNNSNTNTSYVTVSENTTVTESPIVNQGQYGYKDVTTTTTFVRDYTDVTVDSHTFTLDSAPHYEVSTANIGRYNITSVQNGVYPVNTYKLGDGGTVTTTVPYTLSQSTEFISHQRARRRNNGGYQTFNEISNETNVLYSNTTYGNTTVVTNDIEYYNNQPVYYSKVTFEGDDFDDLINTLILVSGNNYNLNNNVPYHPIGMDLNNTNLQFNFVIPFNVSMSGSNATVDVNTFLKDVSFTADYYTDIKVSSVIKMEEYAADEISGYVSSAEPEEDEYITPKEYNKLVYKKTIPTTGGSASIELIDNPFTDRAYARKIEKTIRQDQNHNFLNADNEILNVKIVEVDGASPEDYIVQILDEEGNVTGTSTVGTYDQFVWDLTSNQIDGKNIVYGFGGWSYAYDDTTSSGTFSYDVDGVTQKLDISNLEDGAEINLYANWKVANVVYVSPNGNNSNSGLLPTEPKLTLASAYTTLNDNSTVNDRELNIIVLCATKNNNGNYQTSTFASAGLPTGGDNVPYTITSISEGIDYRNYTTLRLSGSTQTLQTDFQMDNTKIYSTGGLTSNNISETREFTTTYTNLSCDGYNARIGRGMVLNTGTVVFHKIRGGNLSNSKVVVESGSYNGMWEANYSGSGNVSDRTRKFVVGNDIDRVLDDNDSLVVYSQIVARDGGGQLTNNNNPIFKLNIKSGTIGIGHFQIVSDDNIYAGIYVGGRLTGTTVDIGDRELIVEGGKIANIIGGLCGRQNDTTTHIYVKGSKSNIQSIVGGAGLTKTGGDRIISVTAGLVEYSVAGGSNGVLAYSDTQNGVIEGSSLIYIGGEAKIGDDDSTNRINIPNTNYGYTTGGTHDLSDGTYLNGVRYGSVLGGGNGNANRLSGQVNTSHVIIDGNAQIAYDVVGGGNYGFAGTSTSTTISGGTSSSTTHVASYQAVTSFSANKKYVLATGTEVGSSQILTTTKFASPYQNKRLVAATLSNELSNNMILKVSGSGNNILIQNLANEYLAGYNNNSDFNFAFRTQSANWSYNNNKISCTIRLQNNQNRTYYLNYVPNNGNPYITLSDAGGSDFYFLEVTEGGNTEPQEIVDGNIVTTIDILDGKINHNVFGGANNYNTRGSILINQSGGTIEQTMYGGAYNSGQVYQTTRINITGGTINAGTSDPDTVDDSDGDAIFAGGLGASTQITLTGTVQIHDTDGNVVIKGNIYGGSAEGAVNGAATVQIIDDPDVTNKISITGDVYGAGKGSDTNAALNYGNISVYIDGGTYNNNDDKTVRVFGGANVNGTIRGDISVDIGPNYDTTVYQVYGGGNQANLNSNSTTNYVDSVYLHSNATVYEAFNGGNQAGINNNFAHSILADGATITSGLFGGSNTSGTVTGTDVIMKNEATAKIVCGGGKGSATIINNNTSVDIDDSTVTEAVYGGGYEGTVTGNTVITIDNSTIEDTFGGGYKGTVSGTTTDTINSSTVKNVYGGGKGETATVTGAITVTIGNSSIITNDVYGGGDLAKSLSTTIVSIDDSTVNHEVYGGGNGNETESSEYGSVSGNTTVNITGETKVGTTVGDATAGNVFGGGKGNSAKVNKATVNILEDSIIYNNVYGGGNNGKVTTDTVVTIDDSKVYNETFGAGKGTNATVTRDSTISVIDGSQIGKVTDSTLTGGYVYGGGDAGKVGRNTLVTVDDSEVYNSIFGAGKGESATVTGNAVVNVGLNSSNTITVGKILNGTAYGTIYGGGYAGQVGGNTTVTVDDTNVYGYVYGAGKGQNATVTGNATTVLTNSQIGYLNGEDILGGDVYGGGEEGTVGANSDINILNCTIYGSAFGGGKGSSDPTVQLAPVKGNSHIVLQGDTTVYGNAYGSGNSAATGNKDSYSEASHGKSVIDIAGATINGSAYGGANHALIYGDAVLNIGVDAINEYYGSNQNYDKGKIYIGDTIYGGSESADLTVTEINFDSICVYGDTFININGNGYDVGTDTIDLEGSIYGSGNASKASSWGKNTNYIANNYNGYVVIKNYGSASNLKRFPSIQRAREVKLYSTGIILTGALNSTKTLDTTKYSFNIIYDLYQIGGSRVYINATTNYLCNYSSMLNDTTYASASIKNVHYNQAGTALYTIDGNAIKRGTSNSIICYYNDGYYYSDAAFNNKLSSDSSTVEEILQWDKDTYRITTTAFSVNVDNRVYMLNGQVDFNICKSSDPSLNSEADWGNVKGMSFLGVFSDNGTTVYEGIYSSSFTAGNNIAFEQRDFLSSIAKGKHENDPEQDLHIDGFYTNYELLTPEYLKALDEGNAEILDSTNYSSYFVTSYTAYVGVDPQDSNYYRWIIGSDQNIYTYDVDLLASKFTSLGSKSLKLEGLTFKNAKFSVTGFSLVNKDDTDLHLINSDDIPIINSDQDAANKVFGLTMKTANSGWSKGIGLDLMDINDTQDYQVQSGYTNSFQHENKADEPSVVFTLTNSTNITETVAELGVYRLEFFVSYNPSKYTEKYARVIITISIGSKFYDFSGYDGAVAPGRLYTIFANEENTNVTKDSTFTTYFKLSEQDFFTIYDEDLEGNKIVDRDKTALFRDLYDNSYRALLTKQKLPVGTAITMIDYSVDASETNGGPRYYYYTVTGNEPKDWRDFYTYPIEKFTVMGSEDETYDEDYWKEQYYRYGYEIEYFQFIIDLSNATYATNDDTLIEKDQIRFELKSIQLDNNDQRMRDANGFYIEDHADLEGPLAELYEDMKTIINYAVYNKSAEIEIDPSISSNKVYLGNVVEINSDISYTVSTAGLDTSTVYDTTYFDRKIGVKLTMFLEEENNQYTMVTGSDLLGTYFEVNGENYYPRTDGTTRMKVADNANANISVVINLHTEDSSLTSGHYKIQISTFASADGIYYGSDANLSTTKEFEIDFINESYGLKSTVDENDVIIDVESGYTLDSKGYTSTDDQTVNIQLDYLSGYSNPLIAVSLDRRVYSQVYMREYTPRDFLSVFKPDFEVSSVRGGQDGTLEKIVDVDGEAYSTISGDLDNKYILLTKADLLSLINTDDITENTELSLAFDVDDGSLVSGTYKVVFTLYDVTEDTTIAIESTVIDDQSGQPVTVVNYQTVNLYEKIGDIFSYIIIK